MSRGIVSAVILAAGESRRMGYPKLLLHFGGSTILEQTIDNILNSKVDEIIVVLGYKAQEMKGLITDRPVKAIVNPDFGKGMGTSIATGLSVISGLTQGIMLVLADQPRISSQTINDIIEAFFSHNADIIVPVYKGRRGHPVIFDIRFKDELLMLKGDIGGREIVNRYPDDILEVTVSGESIYTDIDTAADYDVERRQVKQK